jgi:hypothetical protein
MILGGKAARAGPDGHLGRMVLSWLLLLRMLWGKGTLDWIRSHSGTPHSLPICRTTNQQKPVPSLIRAST